MKGYYNMKKSAGIFAIILLFAIGAAALTGAILASTPKKRLVRITAVVSEATYKGENDNVPNVYVDYTVNNKLYNGRVNDYMEFKVEKGDNLTIYVNPNNPYQFSIYDITMVANKTNPAFSIIMFIVGPLMIAGGIFLVFKLKLFKLPA